jgi:hypothetical protein
MKPLFSKVLFEMDESIFEESSVVCPLLPSNKELSALIILNHFRISA